MKKRVIAAFVVAVALAAVVGVRLLREPANRDPGTAETDEEGLKAAKPEAMNIIR